MVTGAKKIYLILNVVAFFWRVDANPFCYGKCGDKNTVCAREPCSLDRERCGADAKMEMLNQYQRIVILDHHNMFRSLVASGMENKGGNAAAMNMMTLSYSLQLEFIAQCWANACRQESDECRTTPHFPHVGQNIFLSTEPQSARLDITLGTAVASWFNEIEYITKGVIEKYRPEPSTEKATQLLWGMSMFIGCGRTFTRSNVFIVCNYAPAGNNPGERVYVKGKPCVLCNCSSKYPSLCGIDRIDDDSSWMPPFVLKASLPKSNFLIVITMLAYVLPLQCDQ